MRKISELSISIYGDQQIHGVGYEIKTFIKRFMKIPEKQVFQKPETANHIEMTALELPVKQKEFHYRYLPVNFTKSFIKKTFLKNTSFLSNTFVILKLIFLAILMQIIQLNGTLTCQNYPFYKTFLKALSKRTSIWSQ